MIFTVFLMVRLAGGELARCDLNHTEK